MRAPEAHSGSDGVIPVLDRGYVRLVEVMGSDLSVVNAARASYMKESRALSDRDRRLIRFLAEHGHQSPFRHAVLAFEVKTPMMVMRQWHKYRVGWSHGPDTAELLGVELPHEVAEWLGLQGEDHGFDDPLYARNEASRRYVTLPPEFYVPAAGQWRSKPEHSKQGSGDPVPPELGAEATRRLQEYIAQGLRLYEWALAQGICAEQARLFLPMYGLYTTWRWVASLAGVCHFLNQRLADDAQREIQAYAQAVYALVRPLFPESVASLVRQVPAAEGGAAGVTDAAGQAEAAAGSDGAARVGGRAGEPAPQPKSSSAGGQ